MQSVVSQAMKGSTFQRSLIREITINHGNDLFMRRPVKELTFGGYVEPMMKELGELKGEELLPNNTFGLYYGVSLDIEVCHSNNQFLIVL